jgi:phenylacetate-CoA ligase
MLDQIRLISRTVSRYFFFRNSQQWTREQIDAYHDAKLREVIRHAGKYVPYYRNLFREIGVDPNTFRGREDIHRIPLLDKDIVRSQPEAFVADVSHHYHTMWEKTSGSTGTPLRILLDMGSRANKFATVYRAYEWAGYRPGRRVFMIKGLSESKPHDYGFTRQQNQLYFNSSRLTEENCLAVGKLLNQFRPSFYVGYTRSFIDFHKVLKVHNIPIPKPVGMFCYGETTTPEMREYVENAYNTHLFDFYSHAENTVMICELPNHKRHICEDYFYPEVLDDQGNPASDGYGELIGTSFYNLAMPFIRYKTRDRVQIGKDVPGTAFRQVTKVEGRMDDHLLLPDGRKIYFAEGALGYAKGVVVAQYIQDAIDHVIVNLIVDDSFSTEYYPEIEKGLKKRLGDVMKYEFRVVDELEKKSSGKAPFIINKIAGK